MIKASEFYEVFSEDEAMQERANALILSGEVDEKTRADAIVDFAKNEGYSFTADELRDFIDSRQLSEEELRAVAGGETYDPSTGTMVDEPHDLGKCR
jgi:predicted ribosomally synthesized peptide with nif11-like leader